MSKCDEFLTKMELALSTLKRVPEGPFDRPFPMTILHAKIAHRYFEYRYFAYGCDDIAQNRWGVINNRWRTDNIIVRMDELEARIKRLEKSEPKQ